jgi:hypothetical protein
MLKSALDSLAIRVGLVIIVSFLAVAGAGFLLASVHLWLAEIWDHPAAAFSTGVIALVAAAIPLVVFWVRGRGSAKPPADSGADLRATESSEAAAMAGALGLDLGSWIKANSRTAVAGALLLGVLFGASPRARSEVRKFIATAGTGRHPRI